MFWSFVIEFHSDISKVSVDDKPFTVVRDIGIVWIDILQSTKNFCWMPIFGECSEFIL